MQLHKYAQRTAGSLVTAADGNGRRNGAVKGCFTVSQAHDRARASLVGTVAWRKSSYSSPSGNCVEVVRLPADGVAVRDSRFPDGSALIFAAAEWEAFLRGVKAGDFCCLASRLWRGGRPAWDTPYVKPSAVLTD